MNDKEDYAGLIEQLHREETALDVVLLDETVDMPPSFVAGLQTLTKLMGRAASALTTLTQLYGAAMGAHDHDLRRDAARIKLLESKLKQHGDTTVPLVNGGASTTASGDLVGRITQYLSKGGLFNPEMAMHDRVSDLLIACRDELLAGQSNRRKLVAAHIKSDELQERLSAAEAKVDASEVAFANYIQSAESKVDALREALQDLRKQCDHQYRLDKSEWGKKGSVARAKKTYDFIAACEKADEILK